MNTTLGLRRLMQLHPDGVSTICGTRHRTWRESAERVQKLASALQNLGAETGERIAVLSQNSDRYFETYLAVAWAGAVIVPLNVRWNVAENEDALRDCRASILMADDAFGPVAAVLAERLPELRLIHMGDAAGGPGFRDYEALIAQHAPIPDAMRAGDELAGIFYTGGTTGRPKGVMLSHHNIMTNVLNCLAVGVLDQNPRYLHVAPMFHLGNGAGMYTNMLLGGVNIMIPAFTPAAVAEVVALHRVTHMMLAPTMIQMLVDSPDIDGFDLSSLQKICYGASPISEGVLDRAMSRLPGVKFSQAYGMTETLVTTFLLPPEHDREGRRKGRLRSAGKVAPACELRIVDQNRDPVPRGVTGEIAIRGDTVMSGYWERPEETAAVLADGWMYTGDGGYMDSEGFLYIVDRIKDMIITGGENVYSVEVENVLSRHPAVAQCAVIGLPHDTWGEQVHAVVVLHPGIDADSNELIAFSRETLAPYKCPRSLSFSDQPLPMSGAGKVLKRALREQFGA